MPKEHKPNFIVSFIYNHMLVYSCCFCWYNVYIFIKCHVTIGIVVNHISTWVCRAILLKPHLQHILGTARKRIILKKIMAENDDFFCWLPPRASIEGYSSLHYIFIHFNYYHNLHKNIYLTPLCFIRMLRMWITAYSINKFDIYLIWLLKFSSALI